MNRLILTTAIAVFAMTGVAHAESSDSASSMLSATVVPTCCIDSANLGSADFAFGSQINATDALLTAAGQAISIAAYCNDASTTLALASTNGGLTDLTVSAIAGSGTFAGVTEGVNGRVLDYATSGGAWAGVPFASELNTGGATPTAGALSTTAINGNIVFNITLAAQGSPVLAGTYSDTLTVTLNTGP